MLNKKKKERKKKRERKKRKKKERKKNDENCVPAVSKRPKVYGSSPIITVTA